MQRERERERTDFEVKITWKVACESSENGLLPEFKDETSNEVAFAEAESELGGGAASASDYELN